MEQVLNVRVPRLAAEDVDFLRAFARARGFRNTAAGTVRFAVQELALRLRHTGLEPPGVAPDGRPVHSQELEPPATASCGLARGRSGSSPVSGAGLGDEHSEGGRSQ